MIEFEGETYRDDRKYVINLSRGALENGTNTVTMWLLTTYRNTVNLPPNNVNEFESREEAILYLKGIAPATPLISKNGNPLDIPEDVDPWEYWNDWLKKNDLVSALSGRQNVPYWVNKKGYIYKSDYQEVVQLTEEDLN